ncbi:MAG: RidA family protein [Polyangiaceae bacterium]|nr:RidA family protein [Myxococcales bacterium]MCB9584301.1 RidA family protein [Polyangiaceae bacterium]
MTQPAARQTIQTSDAPAAIGPYSQAVRTGDLLFLSGQIPLDPKSGELVSGSVADETHRVMQNLGAVLKAAGSGYGDVVKTTIYLMDMADFTQVNEVYATYFDENPPARATVQVAGLPKGVRVEIDAIARVSGQV